MFFKKQRYDFKIWAFDEYLDGRRPSFFWWWISRLTNMEWPFVQQPDFPFNYAGHRAKRRELNGQSYYSQACQDLFVITMLDGKQNGRFLEIGAGDSFESNNTFLLEKNYGWFGVAIEFNKDLADKYNLTRKALCLNEDATKSNYLSILERVAVRDLEGVCHVDYLQLDIDPASNTYKALQRIPFDKYRFAVITYEHDAYVGDIEYMLKSRQLLEAAGYELVAKNVKCFGRDFEDWWVHPDEVPLSIRRPYFTSRMEFKELMQNSAI